MKGGERFIISRSAGLRCPASKLYDINDWAFNKAGEDAKERWEEEGVVVRCIVHDQSSDK